MPEKIVNGVSLKRCILGIKPKEAKEEIPFVEEVKEQQSDLDYGLSVHPEVRVEELEKELREEKKQHFELSIKFDDTKEELQECKAELEELRRVKAELDELKKWKAESYQKN